jgi:hypothetical protein
MFSNPQSVINDVETTNQYSDSSVTAIACDKKLSENSLFSLTIPSPVIKDNISTLTTVGGFDGSIFSLTTYPGPCLSPEDLTS